MINSQSVLFVCWGNVCRSPAAELLLKREMKRRGLGHVHVASAGVDADYKTRRPSFGMLWAAFCRGIWLRPVPRLFRKADCAKYDLVVAMDREVHYSIRAITGATPSNVKLLSEFLPADYPVDIPDPMNRPVAKCREVLDMMDRACRSISEQLDYTTPLNVGNVAV